MKRWLILLLAIVLVCSCTACHMLDDILDRFDLPDDREEPSWQRHEEPTEPEKDDPDASEPEEEPSSASEPEELPPTTQEPEELPSDEPEPTEISAAEEGSPYPAKFDPEAPDGDTASQSYAALMDCLVDGLQEYDGSQGETFPVTIENPFSLPQEERYEFFDTLFLHTIRENPEFFWVNLGDRPHAYDPETNSVTYSVSIFPEFQTEGFAAANQVFEETVDAIVSRIFSPDMSEAEKVLSAAGWMKQYVQYDAEQGWDSYSAYSALVNRSAVCHGSAVAMNLLMREVGMDCCTVISSIPEQNKYHVWNAVKVNGVWYDLDPTASYVPGHQGYGGFLRSTEELLDGGIHYEHITRMHVRCDQPYSGDMPWRTANTAFLYSSERKALVNVENCMIVDGTLYLADTATYRTVTIDEAGRAVSTPIATIPAIVFCCSPEYENRLYYMTYAGELRVHELSSGEDWQLTSGNYKGYYLYLDEMSRELLILNDLGEICETLPISE